MRPKGRAAMRDDGEDDEKKETKSRNSPPTRVNGSSRRRPPPRAVQDGDGDEAEEEEGAVEEKAPAEEAAPSDEDWQEEDGAEEEEEDDEELDDAEEEEEETEQRPTRSRSARRPQPQRRSSRARKKEAEEEVKMKEDDEDEDEGAEPRGDGDAGDGDGDAAAESSDESSEAEPVQPVTDSREISLTMKALNPHFACSLCKGYYREATAIIECAHTFCKICLSSYIDATNEHDEVKCPKRNCSAKLRSADPLRNETKFDRALQNLVDKLLPQFLQKDEALKRELQENAGLKRSTSDLSGKRKRVEAPTASMLFELVPHSSSSLPPLSRPIIRVNAKATVKSLRRLIVKVANIQGHDDTELLVLCCDELLGPDHSLEFVWRTRWHEHDRHMTLTYRLLQ